MQAKDAIELYNLFKENGIAIWVDGGWGVDALLGKQTRPHKDLDIAIEKKYLPKFRKLLKVKGYKEIKLEIARPHNFVLGDNQGHEIDVHAIVLNDKGDGVYGPVENGQMYPAASLIGSGIIEGQRVRCISAEWLVKFHSGYKLKDKDFQDVSALCEKFDIELPEEYKKFAKNSQKPQLRRKDLS